MGAAIGARLTQSFTVTNRGAVAADVGFARLLDADLGWNDTVTPDLATGFDDSNRDDGGVTVIDGVRHLFQADPPEGAPDARGGNAREPSFVGVAAAFDATPAGLAPDALREAFEIADRPARLDAALRAGVGLHDADHAGGAGRILDAAATGETAFVDVARDLAMALVNDLEGLGAGQSATYVTHTVFGAVKGVAPGDVEAAPLLPDAVTDEDGFAFALAAEDVVERQTIFIDPPVAVGYVYVGEGGATVYSVTAPTRAAAPDADGYRLFFDGAADGPRLAPGETVILSAQGVTTFRIEGLDTALMLAPDNPTAFVTGVALEGFAALRRTGDGAIRITQTPIVIDVPDVAPVPLPAPAALLLGGMGCWSGAGVAGGFRSDPPCASKRHGPASNRRRPDPCACGGDARPRRRRQRPLRGGRRRPADLRPLHRGAGGAGTGSDHVRRLDRRLSDRLQPFQRPDLRSDALADGRPAGAEDGALLRRQPR